MIRTGIMKVHGAALAGALALTQSATPAFAATGAEVDASSRRPVAWNKDWPRFQSLEYALTPLLLGGGLALRFAAEPPKERALRGGVLIDEALQSAVAVPEPGFARSFWIGVSEASFYGAMAHPFIDAVVVAGAVHGSPDVAWQMLMINMEAFAVMGLGIFATQLAYPRERPYGPLCDERGERAVDSGCDRGERWRSFPSGHVAIAVTGAMLACQHHARLPLYGGGVGDSAACWGALALAAGNAIGRIAANKHYLSDVIVGIGVGLFAGYVVPAALHYGFFDRRPRGDASSAFLVESAERLSEPRAAVSIPLFAASGEF